MRQSFGIGGFVDDHVEALSTQMRAYETEQPICAGLRDHANVEFGDCVGWYNRSRLIADPG